MIVSNNIKQLPSTYPNHYNWSWMGFGQCWSDNMSFDILKKWTSHNLLFMNNYNKKLKFNEFIFLYVGFYLLNIVWVFIILFLILQLILTFKTHYEIGVYIGINVFFGLFFGIIGYIYYWTAKGVIMQKKIPAIIAIIIINYPYFHPFKYDFNSMVSTIYNIFLSILLLYSIIYSLRVKSWWMTSYHF